VLLITLDTFRADAMGCAGHPVIRTPFLDRLARGGVHWSRAVTAIPLTTPSHASILTGRSPRSHGLIANRMVLDERVPTLPEVLGALGYRTGAVVSARTVLGPEFRLDRGFDDYVVMDPPTKPPTGQGAQTTALARAWLRENGGSGSFLWVHYFDAHIPYLPPPPLDRLYDDGYDGPFDRPDKPYQSLFREMGDYDPRDIRHLIALYASEVTFLDRTVGGLLRDDNLHDATVLLTADHGEGLFEHEDYFGHDVLLYDTALRVPMILAGADRRGEVVAEPACTVDVCPTLLGLCGLGALPGTEGRDLLGDPPPTGEAVRFLAETHPDRGKGQEKYAVRTHGRKVIVQNRGNEYYDLVLDPDESDHLGDDPGERFDELTRHLEEDLRLRPPGAALTLDDEEGEMDPATLEALKTLGYVD
jgi:arylsulfatase A-like enzyme